MDQIKTVNETVANLGNSLTERGRRFFRYCELLCVTQGYFQEEMLKDTLSFLEALSGSMKSFDDFWADNEKDFSMLVR